MCVSVCLPPPPSPSQPSSPYSLIKLDFPAPLVWGFYFSIVAPQAELLLDTTTAGASCMQQSCFVVYYIILGCDIHKIYHNYGYACMYNYVYNLHVVVCVLCIYGQLSYVD